MISCFYLNYQFLFLQHPIKFENFLRSIKNKENKNLRNIMFFEKKIYKVDEI